MIGTDLFVNKLFVSGLHYMLKLNQNSNKIFKINYQKKFRGEKL